MSELTIRELRQHDEADVNMMNAFFDQMGPESRGFFNRNDGNRKDCLIYLEGRNVSPSVRWVAEDGSKAAGYVFLWDIDCGVPWFGIAVGESYKGQHLGEKLINTCKEYCAQHGKGGILLTTHQANLRGQCLYERCGFERLGNHWSGEVQYLWRMK